MKKLILFICLAFLGCSTKKEMELKGRWEYAGYRTDAKGKEYTILKRIK